MALAGVTALIGCSRHHQIVLSSRDGARQLIYDTDAFTPQARTSEDIRVLMDEAGEIWRQDPNDVVTGASLRAALFPPPDYQELERIIYNYKVAQLRPKPKARETLTTTKIFQLYADALKQNPDFEMTVQEFSRHNQTNQSEYDFVEGIQYAPSPDQANPVPQPWSRDDIAKMYELAKQRDPSLTGMTVKAFSKYMNCMTGSQRFDDGIFPQWSYDDVATMLEKAKTRDPLTFSGMTVQEFCEHMNRSTGSHRFDAGISNQVVSTNGK
jgi:hypothetical protein